MTFHDRLKQIRLRYNVTQRAICERTGMDTAYYSRMETGKLDYHPRRETIEAIATTIGCRDVELNLLLMAAGKYYLLPPNAEGCRDALREILRRYPELKDEVKR